MDILLNGCANEGSGFWNYELLKVGMEDAYGAFHDIGQSSPQTSYLLLPSLDIQLRKMHRRKRNNRKEGIVCSDENVCLFLLSSFLT